MPRQTKAQKSARRALSQALNELTPEQIDELYAMLQLDLSEDHNFSAQLSNPFMKKLV